MGYANRIKKKSHPQSMVKKEKKGERKIANVQKEEKRKRDGIIQNESIHLPSIYHHHPPYLNLII
jgi:hypothetical protein